MRTLPGKRCPLCAALDAQLAARQRRQRRRKPGRPPVETELLLDVAAAWRDHVRGLWDAAVLRPSRAASGLGLPQRFARVLHRHDARTFYRRFAEDLAGVLCQHATEVFADMPWWFVVGGPSRRPRDWAGAIRAARTRLARRAPLAVLHADAPAVYQVIRAMPGWVLHGQSRAGLAERDRFVRRLLLPLLPRPDARAPEGSVERSRRRLLLAALHTAAAQSGPQPAHLDGGKFARDLVPFIEAMADAMAEALIALGVRNGHGRALSPVEVRERFIGDLAARFTRAAWQRGSATRAP